MGGKRDSDRMEYKMPDFDDKDIVIICATLLACVAMFILPDAGQVVSNVITGLFGVAVGKSKTFNKEK